MNNSNTLTALSLGDAEVPRCSELTPEVEGRVASLRGQRGAAPAALQLPCPNCCSSSKMYFSGWAGASSLLYVAHGSDILGEGVQRRRPDQRGDTETQAAALRGHGFPAQRDEI